MFPVSQFMTKDPQRISVDVTLASAHKAFLATHARHLPVVDGSRLVGIVSLTDLYFAERGGAGRKLTVKDAMEPPVTVTPDTRLGKVAERMANAKVGAVVVVDAGKIAGIFTTIDALRVLASLATPPAERSVYEAIQAATVGTKRSAPPRKRTGSSRAPPKR
jgi:acetoin utilization protein AcuB